MAAIEAFVAKHAAKIRGTLCCFDRVLFRGYLPLMSGLAMADFLKSKQVQRWTLKPFLLKQSAQMTRLLRRLHAHGLIAKIPHSRRWRVSLCGRGVMAAALKLREVAYPSLYAEAA